MNAIFRSITLFAIALLSVSSIQAQLNLSSDAPSDETVIEFERLEYDMGNFEPGDTVHGVFRFKNAGQSPLLIDNVKPSCTCTKLIYPEKPIKPGESGEILASIDTEGKYGEQTKWFMVFYNGNPPMERVTMKFNITDGSEGPMKEEQPEAPKEEIKAPAPAPQPAPVPQPAPKGKKAKKNKKRG